MSGRKNQGRKTDMAFLADRLFPTSQCVEPGSSKGERSTSENRKTHDSHSAVQKTPALPRADLCQQIVMGEDDDGSALTLCC